MAEAFTPKDDLMAEALALAEELSKGSESYIPRLRIIFDNMDSKSCYSGAKEDLFEYIRLFSITEQGGTRTGEESNKMQDLGKKLRGVVIPENVYAGSNIPEKSGDVLVFSRVRVDALLKLDKLIE